MTNRHTIARFILIALVLAGTGCKKELNVYPTTQEVNGDIITDQTSATTALNGVYYCFADAGTDYNGVPTTLWYNDHEQTPSQLSGMISYTYGGGGYDQHLYNAKTAGFLTLWTYGYKLVNAANGFLENLAPATGVTAASKAQMTAEARFLRAYGNSTLLLYFGQCFDTTSAYGIILRDQLTTTANTNMPRATVAASYDSILSDLDAAIPALPSLNTASYYANSWAAKLLKARVLINRGSAADYAEVIALTQDIIANGPFVLEANVKDLFWTKGLASQEVMLGIQPYPNQVEPFTDYIRYDYYEPNSFSDSLFANDPRSAWYIQTVKTAFGTYPAVTKYYPGSLTNIANNTFVETSYALRLTEAYLLEAEAIAASNGNLATAKTLLETVLSHAGVTDFSAVDNAATAAQLKLLIIVEEMKSFVDEAGQDWFALRRLPFATIQSMLPSITNQSLLVLPIPQSEILANPDVQQNPNY
jgi:hypothetical protein